eukprot:3107726-Prymnesium_polylepis.1
MDVLSTRAWLAAPSPAAERARDTCARACVGSGCRRCSRATSRPPRATSLSPRTTRRSSASFRRWHRSRRRFRRRGR